jgi:ATP-dependent Lon protease
MPQDKITLPLLVTRGLFVFPGNQEQIEVGRPYSVAAVDASRAKTNSLILITAQKAASVDDITVEDIFEDASLCRIANVIEAQGAGYQIRVEGSKRAHLEAIRMEDGSFVADATIIQDAHLTPNDELPLARQLSAAMDSAGHGIPSLPRSIQKDIRDGVPSSPSYAADAAAGMIPAPIEEKRKILAEPDVSKRLKALIALIDSQREIDNIDHKLDEKVRERAEQSQKEYFLREKMKAIKDELGEGGDNEHSADAIKERLEKNPYPENVKKKVRSELHRYEMMPDASLEGSLILSYIETLMNVPWYQSTEDNEDLDNAQKILDEDHYGLKKVKERIIEYLAVKKKTGNLKAPILCFYGPPGCGKTSLAKSIARALGRKFFKASLGGVYDEAEIRGHRRTYVGSMPGRIIQGMTKAGVTNPVFLLDEIDKVGSNGLHGDPSSALLEVLDPEQNVAFNDNYIEEPYDLSNVLFICTANYLENVPEPLLDRLELIEVPSYTELEKIKIAEGFLVKKQMKANGLKDTEIKFTEDGIKEIIEFYTREAGVRQLERLIAACCRKAIVEVLKDKKTSLPIVIDKEKVNKYLGPEFFLDTKKEKAPQIGVVTGLAYTEFGGDILPIEVTSFPGKGGLILTGKLGDVMKESATIAVDYVRANAHKYGIDDDVFGKNDIHIHFPEGAVPKDGPSAGVAITTAIISLLSKIPVDNNVAMTGEVTLRGNALPIGGLREKSLAALRSGIKTIIVPEENKKDVDELPEEVKKELKIIYMKTVDDAVKVALLKPPAAKKPAKGGRAKAPAE